MSMKVMATFVLFIGLASCVDASKSDKLEKIEQLSNELDMSVSVLNADLLDSLATAIELGRETKTTIKEHFGADTMTLERAFQIDAYSKHIEEFEHLRQLVPTIKQNSNAIHDALVALKFDIEQEAGNRSKYKDQLKMEEEKVVYLVAQVDSMLLFKNKGFISFYELHNNLSDFSLKLVEQKVQEE